MGDRTRRQIRAFFEWADRRGLDGLVELEDERLDPVVTTASYLEATQDVLHKHGGLWFNDEAFVVTRSGVGPMETVGRDDLST